MKWKASTESLAIVFASALLALASAHPAHADAIVTTCTDAGLGTALASGGTITFNCGGPATIVVTTDSRQINSTVTLNGGGQITLQGSEISTFFWVRSPSGNLTLDGIRLTGANSGGNVLFSDGALTLRNCALYGNASAPLFARTGSALFENTSIVNNAAGSLSDVNMTLRNVTYLGNNGSHYARSGTTTLSNTILAANTGGNCVGVFTSTGNNISSDTSCSLNQPTDKPNTQPLLEAAVNGFATPAATSPAIDTGTCLSSRDGLGQPRPGTGTALCDIGAVERQNVSPGLSKRRGQITAQ